MKSHAGWRLAIGVALSGWMVSTGPLDAQLLFTDAFDGGLAAWEVYGVESASTFDSGDPSHGEVLRLRPNGDAHVLIRGSDRWQGVRMEGDVLFPENEHNYLGVVYNFVQRGERMDFGNIYIKGNGSYLQVNPHRDYNVGRTLYSELSVNLDAPDAVVIGEWIRFAVEVVGSTCHFYVGDMVTPKLTFSDLELEGGSLGFQPRSVGGDVWVDNVRVTDIDGLSYGGPEIPQRSYRPAELLTDWQVLGPLPSTFDEAARHPGGGHNWQPFSTDARGAVVSGRVVDSHGAGSVAYFRTRVRASEPGEAMLHLSTIDDIALWVNGRFHWFVDRARRAWPDFWRNPDHTGQRIPIDLVEGDNEIVIRVRGGVYATGGFFARVEPSAR